MPSFDEVSQYLSGVWLLIRGRPEGFALLDISANGFWRSFWAIVWCLPASAVAWASYRLAYLRHLPDGATLGDGFILTIAAIDLVVWVAPLIILALAARPLGVSRQFPRFVIASNWLSVPLSYALALPLAVLMAFGIADMLLGVLSLLIIGISAGLLYRIAHASFDRDAAFASGVTVVIVIVSLTLGDVLQSMAGITLVQ